MTQQIQNDPIMSLPYTYGTGISLAWGSNTTLTVGSGQYRDSNDVMDLVLGSAPLNGAATATPYTINAAINGYGGLDTGALAASSMYAIYLIGDSSYFQPVGAILTLASNAAPLMPFGYDSYRLVGFWATDGSSHFLLGYYSATGSKRLFMYDAPQATAITSGTATTYTAINLSTVVPPVANIAVYLQAQITPNAASDTLKLQPQGGTGDMITVIGQVASVANLQQVLMTSVLVSGAPEVAYKLSTASAHAAINVNGFELFV